MKSLIAEDDFTSRVVLKSFLTQYGECDVVDDGRDAVNAIKEAREKNIPYDLVCMDLGMPVMGGQEAIREIRQQEEAGEVLRTTKIIVTTGLSDMENITNALVGKCNAYLMKPIDIRRLIREMRALGLVRE